MRGGGEEKNYRVDHSPINHSQFVFIFVAGKHVVRMRPKSGPAERVAHGSVTIKSNNQKK